MRRVLSIALLLAAAVAAAVLVNVALLGAATSSNDPVGRLSPRAQLPAPPTDVIRPTSVPDDRDSRDD